MTTLGGNLVKPSSKGSKPEQSTLIRIASIISLIFHPALVILMGTALIVYLSVGELSTALGWTGLGLVLFIAPVTIFVFYKLARKQVSDADVSVREQRYDIFRVAGICMLLYFSALLLLDAPDVVIAMLVGGIIAFVAIALTTRYLTKVSIHSGLMAGVTVVAGFYSWPWAFVLSAATGLVAWSRIALKKHTPIEVASGAAIAGGTFWLVMFTQQ